MAHRAQRGGGSPLDRAERLAAAADYRGALAAARQAADAQPRSPRAWQIAGVCELQLANFPAAAAALERTAALGPPDGDILASLGFARQMQGDRDGALEAYDRGLAADPGHEGLTASKAELLRTTGDPEEAARLLGPIVARRFRDDRVAITHGRLCVQQDRPADALPVLERFCADASLSPAARRGPLFLLGDVLDALGRYEEAFRAYEEGNRLGGAPFDAAAHERAVDRLIAAWTPEVVARSAGGPEDELPLLVIGMPRSGTTLVERMLGAHPSVHASGESPFLDRTAIALQRGMGVSCAHLLQHPTLVGGRAGAARIGRSYIDHLRARASASPDAVRVTDKQPTNFMHLGLVAQVIPACRIIHCTRDPLDTGLSCYFQNFAGTLRFTGSLRDIGSYLRSYQRIMAHWRAVLATAASPRMLEVSYEALVRSPSSEAERMVAFAGLPWDDRVLAFHETAAPALTASMDQVRRPVTTASVGRHKHYDRHLEPLRAALGQF